MTTITLKDLAKKMRALDIAMLTTQTADGELASRPMSNNGDVEYDGNSYYFTFEEARLVQDITAHPKVNLSFEGSDGLWISIAGEASLLRDKKTFEKHWVPDLERWFEDGIDTPNLVLVQVKAKRAKVWDGEDQSELTL